MNVIQGTTRNVGRGFQAKMWLAAEGTLLRELREARGLTQDELAGLVGMANKKSISTIETGRMHIPACRLAAFAEALKVDPASFGRALLRVQAPFTFGLIYGTDPQLEGELRRATTRVNRPRSSASPE